MNKQGEKYIALSGLHDKREVTAVLAVTHMGNSYHHRFYTREIMKDAILLLTFGC